MPSASDIETALTAFTLASHKVEDYYRKLETEIQRLTGDLERKNAELQRKVTESDRARAMVPPKEPTQ
ncbi:hypothetical protein IIC65_06415 [Candidatus Sumerlaeota bacterium]|nr:hypothetical protein [Candidatus Sumerlaeota bacterium]